MAIEARLEVRLPEATKSRLVEVAALADEPVSTFVRSAIEERMERLLEEHQLVTRVPVDFYARLVAALDEPAVPVPELAQAVARARRDLVDLDDA